MPGLCQAGKLPRVDEELSAGIKLALCRRSAARRVPAPRRERLAKGGRRLGAQLAEGVLVGVPHVLRAEPSSDGVADLLVAEPLVNDDLLVVV